MYTYPWYHWITFFFTYSFFGWIFESAYVSLLQHRFVNRGFLRMPLLPLYGTGAVMMLWLSLPVKDNVVLVYFAGVIGATVLEYVTGYVMERLFKMKYWDYSNQPFNLNGYICLSSSVAWGFLTIFLTEVIHQPIAALVLSLKPWVEFPIIAVVGAMFAADTVVSVKEALDLGKALEAMTKMKAELDELQVQSALLKAEIAQRMEDLRAELEAKAVEVAGVRTEAAVKAAEVRADAEAKIAEVKAAAAKLGEAGSGAAAKIAEATSGAAAKIGDVKSGAAAKIGEVASGAAAKIGDAKSGAAAKIGEIASGAAIKIGDAKSGAAAKIAGAASSTEARIGDAKSGVAAKTGEVASGTAARLGDAKSGAAAKIVEAASGAAAKIGDAGSEAAARISRLLEESRQREDALSGQILALNEKRKTLTNRFGFYRKGLLRGNPTASSARFSAALKELKEALENRDSH